VSGEALPGVSAFQLDLEVGDIGRTSGAGSELYEARRAIDRTEREIRTRAVGREIVEVLKGVRRPRKSSRNLRIEERIRKRIAVVQNL